MNLLISNYSMNFSNPIFAHQIEAVIALANKFESITVISHEVDKKSLNQLPSNVKVIEAKWIEEKHLKNSLIYLKTLRQILAQNKIDLVFFHMTEVSACLSLFLLKRRKIKSVLWYAHNSKSIYLKIFHRFGELVLTSTDGSNPIKSEKVLQIGQSINTNVFKFQKRMIKKEKFVYAGRVDLSKGIEEMINVLIIFQQYYKNLKFDIYGHSTNPEYRIKIENIIREANNMFSKTWIRLHEPVIRENLNEIFYKSDCFLHNFTGSLDKVILEAASCGTPIVTTNPEFNKIFELSKFLDFKGFFENYLAKSDSEISEEVDKIKGEIDKLHSLDHWANKIFSEFSSL